MRNRITIQEFAENAGVSIATVSRAFTGNGRISPETRKRIFEIAQNGCLLSNVSKSLLLFFPAASK